MCLFSYKQNTTVIINYQNNTILFLEPAEIQDSMPTKFAQFFRDIPVSNMDLSSNLIFTQHTKGFVEKYNLTKKGNKLIKMFKKDPKIKISSNNFTCEYEKR